ncbi:hypothetical protein ACHAPE_000005 [Trichoderma viride]
MASPRLTPSPSPAKGDGKKSRAKHACRECNIRRVRCDVTEKQPCSNCLAAGANCEILPSRRGRYPRRSRRLLQHLQPPIEAGSSLKAYPTPFDAPPPRVPRQDASDPRNPTPQDSQDSQDQDVEESSPSPVPGTRFYGESSFLTLVPSDEEDISSRSYTSRGNNPNSQKQRFTFPLPATPQSTSQTAKGRTDLSPGTMRYLRNEGALTLPDLQSCLPALEAYFNWFHPSWPLLDRAQIARRLANATSFSSVDISRMLLQAMLFIGATYCDAATIRAMGFEDRYQAKTTFYTRTRMLFHADWEKDETVLIQSLFLMSFWRGAPTDVRDVRYWLGIAITLAESYGFHRSSRSMSKDSHTARMRRRIWWTVYVRERQAAASLGLPSRIRDEDCDIEPLSPSDWETDNSGPESRFGTCLPEHVVYAIKMVEIAKLLGKIIDVHFVPGNASLSVTSSNTLRDLNISLEAWRESLPEHIKYSPEEGSDSVWTCLLHLAYK